MDEKVENFQVNRTHALLSDWLNELGRQALQHPRQNAVLGNEICLTRGELVTVVTLLVRQLREAGVAPGSRVAVCLERSPLTVAAFLAVLRLGGTYLPIDTRYPPARVAAMLECKPDALVTTPSIREKIPEVNCPVIFAGTEPDFQFSSSVEDLDPVTDEYPAYIMFTSGSMGSSSGVVVSRGALARYAAALGEALTITGKDVYLHTASFSFSASIRQIIAPLAAGATMVIADEEARHDPFCLLALMKSRGVTVWDTVPSLWKVVESVLAKATSRKESGLLSKTLRLVFLTGEPLSWALVSAWKKHLGDSVDIISLYSQTETAGTVAMFPIPAGDVPETGTVPLGDPLHDIELMALDEDLNPVLPGREGEVYVASERLADRYQDFKEPRPGQFSVGVRTGDKSRRIFQTGDFVLIGTDGSMIPAGRRDHRAKIRGFRVDLLEIETEIENDLGISQAVVLVEASTRLIAYVVPAMGARPLPAEIQARLRNKLPEHAIPGQVVVVDHIPVNANGKVDRTALARLRENPSETSGKPVPAADSVDRDLLQIWEKSLGYKGASIDDDFFEKGGDSLTAVSLFLEIEDHWGIRLPASTLLTSGTAGSLAGLIRGAPRNVLTRSVLELRKGGDLPPLFLVHALWEHIPHFKELVDLLEPDFPVYALEPIRNPGVTSRELDVGHLVREYAREIRKIHPQGPFFLAGWSIGGFMAFSVAVELETRGDNPAGLMLIDSMSPSLRSKLRRDRKTAFVNVRAYLEGAVKRQIRSFRLSPREQWERSVWMLHQAARRLVLFITKPASRRFRTPQREAIRRVFDRYQPPPYKGSAVFFRSEQPAVDPEQDDDLGWSKHIHGKLEIVPLPGDHVTLVIEPRNMRLLAGHISTMVKRDSANPPMHHEPGTNGQQSPMDLFFEETKKLVGQKYTERAPWLNVVTQDAIRHFAYGICDDNPLWTDENYCKKYTGAPLLAPPVFLVAARYPVLHGAALDVPLISLLSEIEYSWERRIHVGEDLRSSTEQGDVREVIDPMGNRKIHVDAQTTYWNGQDQVLGRGRSTVVRMLGQGSMQVTDWSIYRYSPGELERITQDIQSETRTGSRGLSENEFTVGARLPSIVRGPLTIGDMVCWHAAVGPSYRPGPLGYKDTLNAPQFRVRNPITGWPIKYMLQHEDVILAHQRGMPAPFDNGVMRFAWVSPLITNWMGDKGFLARLHVKINLPVLYGDTCWYSGEVTRRSKEADSWRVSIRISGTNQHGSVVTTGSADVLLPG